MLVKNFAKFALNFSLWFVLIFLAAAGLRFLSLHIDWIKTLPPKPESSLTLLIAASHWALTFALFSVIIIALSYSARKNYSAVMSLFVIICLSLLFSTAVSFLLRNWNFVPPAQTAAVRLGGDGLILSNSLTRNETSVILLNGNTEPLGPRVISMPDQPLIFQKSAAANFFIPSVPFGGNTPWFLKNLAIDIRLNSDIFKDKFNEGFVPFFIYAGALIFLLSSFGYVIKMSAWHLVNFFLGILIFRGILILITFLNTPEILDVMASFLGGALPLSFAVPAVFAAAGALMHLYSFLVFVTRRKTDDGN